MSQAKYPVSQIPFEFGKYQQYDLDSFVIGENPALVTMLKNIADDRSVHSVYIWGTTGSGKTHLLQAMCKQVNDAGRQVAYIPLSQLDEISPEMLHGLESLDLVCVDDLDLISGQAEWQQVLTWLYNELRDNHHSFIISGLASPKNIALEIADLKSRLEWDQVYQLKEPGDDAKIDILKQRAHQRSFELSDEVVEYLIRRVDRNLVSLMKILDQIDHASLAAKRKITIPFIKELIKTI